MRILAIRGKNLASLSAEFEIDFQREPLASAGLFAITGPTGSGKSTLLDALCLALYERTPRLAYVSGRGEQIPDVGASTVSPNDPRTLLRRGAGEGYAEVDFVGSDAVSYRSRWRVRRAYGHGNGNFQASDIKLLRLADGQNLSEATKTATLKRIEACIGLSFEQFTRAVLLAQNDFATFLKAPDDERAELLQTLTGSETFSELSRQAYARMKAETETLTQLQFRLKDLQPLAAEVRAEKNEKWQSQTRQASALAAQVAALDGHLRWYQQSEQRMSEVSAARLKLDAAMAADLEAAPRQAKLELVERVQSARPLCAEVARLEHALYAAEQTQVDAAAQWEQSLQQAHACQIRQDAARQRIADAQAAKSGAQGDIDQARALDARIDALAPQVQASVLAHGQMQKTLDQALEKEAALAAQICQVQVDLDTTDRWLHNHAHLRPLAAGWQRWEALLSQAGNALASQTRHATNFRDLASQASANAQATIAAEAALATASQHAHAITQQLESLTVACSGVDVDQMAQDKALLEGRRNQLQMAALLWQRHSDLHARYQQLQGQRQVSLDALSASEVTLQECALHHPGLDGGLHSAEQSLNLAKFAASKDAKTLRNELQPEHPCPVCGALEHPYASHSPGVDAVIQQLQSYVDDCKVALRALLERQAHASATKLSNTAALQQIDNDLAQCDAMRARWQLDWTELPIQAALDAVDESERSNWLQRRQEEALHALEQISQKEAALRENAKHRELAQAKANAALQVCEQARETLRALVDRSNSICQAQETAGQSRDEATQLLERAQGQIDSAFAHTSWRVAWLKSPSDFVAQCLADVTGWNQHFDLSASLQQTLQALNAQQAASSAACALALQQRDAQALALEQVQATWRGYCAQRGYLFSGQPLAEVERALQAALTHAQTEGEGAQTALLKAQADVTRLQESVRHSTRQLQDLRLQQVSAQDALDAWLAEFHLNHADGQAGSALSMQALKALLDIASDWLPTEREDLQNLRSAVAAAQAVLATRLQSLSEHQAQKSTALSAEELLDAQRAAKASQDLLADELAALKLEIVRDDENLNRTTSLREQVEQQASVARVWSQLGELIGSADGKKFRNFAQQVTLDILLGYGNRHLQSLSSRYRLQRIRDSLGLLVVDQDMGDELRSVHSLSGGESFLVSLALALGLASLSSHRVRVESLFIDEGFGSLDADSLRVAMDALDSLQSQGRKVGVISHVHEMTERIGTRIQVQRQAGGLSRILLT